MVISEPELGFWPNGGWGNAISMLKALVRETEKTTVIAPKLKRTVRATQQKASMLGVRCQKRLNGREGRNGRLSSTSGDFECTNSALGNSCISILIEANAPARHLDSMR